MWCTAVGRSGLAMAGVTALVAPVPAFAHSLDGQANLLQGLTHPVTGLDHLAAMVAVGLIAAYSKSPRSWTFPGVFIVGMVGGLGLGGPTGGAAVELLIAFSALVLGSILLAGGPGERTGVVAALIAPAGFCHGLAHASDRADVPSSLWFIIGVLTTTMLLHLTGYLAGAAMRELAPARERLALAAAGGGVTAAGLFAIAG